MAEDWSDGASNTATLTPCSTNRLRTRSRKLLGTWATTPSPPTNSTTLAVGFGAAANSILSVTPGRVCSSTQLPSGLTQLLVGPAQAATMAQPITAAPPRTTGLCRRHDCASVAI